MTVCGECGGIAPRVFDLGAYTDETGELYDYVLYPREITHCNSWIRNWMGA